MAKKLSKSTVSELMASWGRKGGSRATQAQKNAARENLKKTPNYQKHTRPAQSASSENLSSQPASKTNFRGEEQRASSAADNQN